MRKRRDSVGGSAGGLDADRAGLGEPDEPVTLGVEGPGAARADVPAGAEDGAALPDQDGAGRHPFAVVPLHPKPFADAITAVLCGPCTGFMRHRGLLTRIRPSISVRASSSRPSRS